MHDVEMTRDYSIPIECTLFGKPMVGSKSVTPPGSRAKLKFMLIWN